MRIAVVAAFCLTIAGCASTGPGPEWEAQVHAREAREAQIRVTTDKEAVRGCESLGIVNADGQYANALFALRHGASEMGGDTAILQDSSKVSDPRWGTLVGPVGEAYRCGAR